MRLREVGDSQRALLQQLARRISRRLEAAFVDLPRGDSPAIGIHLRERDRQVVLELPEGLLFKATEDAKTRDTMRLRIKAGRDRMLFRGSPTFLTSQGADGHSTSPRRAWSGGSPRGRQ